MAYRNLSNGAHWDIGRYTLLLLGIVLIVFGGFAVVDSVQLGPSLVGAVITLIGCSLFYRSYQAFSAYAELLDVE